VARVEFESFGKTEVARIYMASKLREAQRVEEILSSRGIDYYVEVEPFVTYLLGLFPRQQKGVAFYVRADQAEDCNRILMESNLRTGILDKEHQ
jgi:hypothetical protein